MLKWTQHLIEHEFCQSSQALICISWAVVVPPPQLRFWRRLLKEDLGRIVWVNIRMTHHVINRSLHSLQRVHTRCHASSRLGFKLVVAPHRCSQVEEQRNESTTAAVLEQDLEGVS